MAIRRRPPRTCRLTWRRRRVAPSRGVQSKPLSSSRRGYVAVSDHKPTVDFDHMSPEFGRDPAAAFRELRETCPVAWSPHHGGFWVLTRYEDIAAAARDDATF